MKIAHRHSARSRGRRQDGMAVIMVMALIALILIYLAANVRTLHVLHQEMRMIEQQQIHRLGLLQGTNAVSATNSPPTKSVP